MGSLTLVGGALLGASGVAVLIAGLRLSRSRSSVLAYLADSQVDGGSVVAQEPDPERADPLFDRVIRPFARSLTNRVRNLYPSSRLDGIHDQLLHAGLGTTMRAEEFATVQTLAAGLGIVAGLTFLALGQSSILIRFLLSGMLIGASVMGPKAWLSRRVEARTKRIGRDLPDMLDLLTISVEAGLGLEQALESTCQGMDSPLGEEIARTIQEMSLGLSRHQALENLRTRVLAEDVRTFVLVLTQADMLGMPIARVLRTQADEMRDRRRARAREQAAKLPVKILFPLMGFILPPLMIVVLGPAASSIYGAFTHGGI